MAEFCLKCWNEMNKTSYEQNKFVMSEDLDFCEGCGEWKHIIICERKNFWDNFFHFLSFWVKMLCTRNRLILEEGRYECVYKQIADLNIAFCEKKETAKQVTVFFRT